MSVKRCMREVDSPEFAEWMAYSVWEPFGPEREDQRAGMLAALIANVNRDPDKRPKPYSAEDFFPPYDYVAPVEEPADLSSKLTAWAASMTEAHQKSKSKSKSELREKKRKG